MSRNSLPSNHVPHHNIADRPHTRCGKTYDSCGKTGQTGFATSTSFTLCFDQGQVLLLHAPRYMGLNGHVSLAQADMSPWRKQTCHFGANRHVTLEQTDMSPWSKRTCPFWRNGHVPLDTSTLKGINFGLQTRFVVPLAGLTTASRHITAECITRQNCAFTKIRLAPWGRFWYSNGVLRIGC